MRGQLNLLLDTHLLICSLDEPERLPSDTRDLMESPENQVWASSVSIWEIVIKHQLGKFRMPKDLLAGISRQSFQLLGFQPEHAIKVASLPLRHRDPFDRALLAQALEEGLTLLSSDHLLLGYQDVVRLKHVKRP